MTYRADIDGLRAVAVFAVVLFHYQVPGFHGGFSGVDVFFVISGYLITALLQRELDQGRFSLAGFYERRIRRIFPALFTMLAATTLAALVLLFPPDLISFGKSLASAALSVSNFHFWRVVDYFQIGSGLLPLLHTWSLGVEEQFYLLFPLLLFVLRSLPGRLRLGLLSAGALLSLAFFLYTTRFHPQAAFYFLGARGWELLTGGVVALAPKPRSAAARNAAGSVGILLLGVAIVAARPEETGLNINVLCACAGAALVILAGTGPANWTSRLLSLKPLVFAGLLSYSIYLWHWPLLIFAQYYLGAMPGPWARAVLVLLTALLAWLSWKFIEQPFRAKRRLFSRRKIFAMACAIVVTTAVCGWALAASDGLPQRYFPAVRELFTQAYVFPDFWDRCFTRASQRMIPDHVCTFGDGKAPVTVALWGDSHAASALPALELDARKHGKRLAMLALAACAPFKDATRTNARAPDCVPFNKAARRYIRSKGIRTVILAARWRVYDVAGLVDLTGVRNETPDARFQRLLERTIADLTRDGIRVYLVADVPEMSASVPILIARQQIFGRPAATVTLADRNRQQGKILGDFARLATRHQATVLDPAPLLCPRGICRLFDDNHIFYRDQNHLTVYAAAKLAGLFEPVFTQAPRQPPGN
ncbi:MAG TPA: acyltransferase family protein [Rhizomicrobium sp.]|nr:acyltransferase family protein [Rhizomicrobium sp.]